MKNYQIYRGYIAFLWSSIVIIFAFYILRIILIIFGLSKTLPQFIFNNRVYLVIFANLVLVAWFFPWKAKKHTPENARRDSINNCWNLPNISLFILMGIIALIAWIILNIFDSFNMLAWSQELRYRIGFVPTCSLTLLTIGLSYGMADSLHRFYRSLQYNYDFDNYDPEKNVLKQFVDLHPEAIEYIKPTYLEEIGIIATRDKKSFSETS